MAIFTNMSQRLINMPDGTQLVPGIPTEVSDETAKNVAFEDLVKAKEIVSGEPKKDDTVAGATGTTGTQETGTTDSTTGTTGTAQSGQASTTGATGTTGQASTTGATGTTSVSGAPDPNAPVTKAS